MEELIQETQPQDWEDLGLLSPGGFSLPDRAVTFLSYTLHSRQIWRTNRIWLGGCFEGNLVGHNIRRNLRGHLPEAKLLFRTTCRPLKGI